MKKKGQIAIFVVIALIIVVAVIAVISLSKPKEVSPSASYSGLEEIDVKTKECIKKLIEEALYEYGYFEKEALKSYIEFNLKNCTAGFKKINANITEGPVSAEILLQNNELIKAEVKYPLTIIEKETTKKVENFAVEYKLISKLSLSNSERSRNINITTESTKEHLFLEKNSLDFSAKEISLNILDKRDKTELIDIIPGFLFYQIDPLTISPSQQMTFSLPYKNEQIPSTFSKEDLLISHWKNDGWYGIKTQVDSKTISAKIEKPGTYAVTLWKKAEISRFQDAEVNIPYDKSWVIELEGKFYKDGVLCDQEAECLLYTGANVCQGLDWFWWFPGLSMRLYRDHIRFKEANIGTARIDTWPEDHWVTTINKDALMLDGNNHILRVEYHYKNKNQKVYLDDELIGDFDFIFEEMPSPVNVIHFMGFVGEFRYYVDENLHTTPIISQIDVNNIDTLSKVKAIQLGTATEEGFFSSVVYNDILYIGGHGYKNKNKIFSYPPLQNVNPGFVVGESVCYMLKFGDYLYANTETTHGEPNIYRTLDGKNWKSVFSIGKDNVIGCGLTEHKGYLYAPLYNFKTKDSYIYRTKDGINWQKVYSGDDYYLKEILTYKDTIYLPTVNEHTNGGGFLYSADGTNWKWLDTKGPRLFKGTVWKDYLWVVSTSKYSDGESGVWRFDGKNIVNMVEFPGFEHASAILPYRGRLFVATTKCWKCSNSGATLFASMIGEPGTWKEVWKFDESESWTLQEYNQELYLTTRQMGGGGKLYKIRTADEY